MAKRKTPRSKKKGRKQSRKKVPIGHSLLKVTVGFIVLVLLVAAAGFLTHRLLKRQPTRPLTRPPAAEMPKPAAEERPFEIFPPEDLPPPSPLPKPKPRADVRPKVAIIIDDLGYDQHIAQKFLDLDTALTFAVLPFTTHSRSIAASVLRKGGELMLHLPMEPLEYPAVDPGPGALMSDMSPDQLIAQLRKNLSDVPGIKGVNNHMGSKLTAESTRLYQVFSILKQEGLFFIDSRSSAATVGRPSARLFQLPFAERDVFIDHRLVPDFIRGQIHELVRIARKQGEAVGIAHPSNTTLKILKEMLPDLKKEVQLVPASEVVHIIS